MELDFFLPCLPGPFIHPDRSLSPRDEHGTNAPWNEVEKGSKLEHEAWDSTALCAVCWLGAGQISRLAIFLAMAQATLLVKKKFGGERRRGKGESRRCGTTSIFMEQLWNRRLTVEQGAGSLGFENGDSRSSGLLQWEFAADQNELSNEDLSQFVKNRRERKFTIPNIVVSSSLTGT